MYCVIEHTREACLDAEKARPDGTLIIHVPADIFSILRNPYKKNAKPQEKEVGDQVRISKFFLPLQFNFCLGFSFNNHVELNFQLRDEASLMKNNNTFI
jgi:hypothetical protein